jgi:hypothetical protein
MLVLVLVCFKLTLTPPSKHALYVLFINYRYIEVDMGHPLETRYLMGGGCGGF